MQQKRVISKTNLTNMSKSEKSAYFRHIFAIYFFWCIFSKLFQRIRNSAFFDAHIEFFNKKNYFLLFLALFVNFDCKCARNGSKK
jgi:hypothetical protein